MRKIIYIAILLLPLISWAAFPTDDYESYSAGAGLNGLNGGSGWSGAYSGCDAGTTVVSSPTLEGTRAANATVDNDCLRNYPAQSADGQIFHFRVRAAETNALHQWYIINQANTVAYIIFQLRSNGQIGVYNNTTITNIQAYSADTNYQIEIEFTPSNETFRIRIDGGSWNGPYNGYDYTVQDHTQGTKQFNFSSEAGTSYWDDIKDTTPATAKPITPDDAIFWEE